MKVRLFVTTSPLATALMADYASRTAASDQKDFLLMDAIRASQSHIDVLQKAGSLHAFEAFHDLSLRAEEGASRQPSLSKKLTRKLKTLPVFKQVYDFLFQFKLKKEEAEFYKKVVATIPLLADSSIDLEIHTQPNLHLNKALFPRFPKASVSYYEHGLGDYLDLKGKRNREGTFRCVFAEGLSSFLAEHDTQTWQIEPVLGEKGLGEIDFDILKSIHDEIPRDQKVALILLQPLEQQQVDMAFWPAFLQLVTDRLDDQEVLYLLKPHPLQGPESKQVIEDFFRSQNKAFHWMDSPQVRSLNVEFLYPSLESQMVGVFSPFSSAIFYLSYLYPSESVVFGYSLNSMFPFTRQTPQLYLDRWKALIPYLNAIFSKKAEELG